MNEERKIVYASLAELEADQDELVGYRPGADANAFLPPLIHGEYEALVVFDAADPDKRWKEDTTIKGDLRKYRSTSVKITTAGNADEAADGREFTHYMNTLVRRGGTTGVQACLQGCGVPQAELDTSKTSGAQAILCNRTLEGGNAAVTVELDWEASHYDADWVNPETGDVDGKEFFRLRGMERFPRAMEGEPEAAKALLAPDGHAYYPWIDLDITDLEAPVIILPSEPQPVGRNIHRAFVRNFVRRFITRTALSASAAASGSAPGPRVVAAAAPVAAPAPPVAPTAPRPAPVGNRPAPRRA